MLDGEYGATVTLEEVRQTLGEERGKGAFIYQHQGS
jgi:hypothetical protein